MADDTERLQAQVDKLSTELEAAYSAIEVAGEKARGMRADIDRLSEDVRAMAAVLGEVVHADVPDDIKVAARAALAGTHVELDGTHAPELVADIVRKYEAVMTGSGGIIR